MHKGTNINNTNSSSYSNIIISSYKNFKIIHFSFLDLGTDLCHAQGSACDCVVQGIEHLEVLKQINKREVEEGLCCNRLSTIDVKVTPKIHSLG